MTEKEDRPEPAQPERRRNRTRRNLEIVGVGGTLALSAVSIYQSFGKHINTALLAVISSIVVAVLITLVGFLARKDNNR